MNHNLLLAWLVIFFVLYSFKRRPIANYDSSVILVKEIASLLSLQLMYSYLNELTLYAGVLYMQPSLYRFSSWLHIDITPLGCSVTYTFLASQQRCFWDRISNLFESMHVGFSATQNMCDRYNKFVIDLYSVQCSGSSVIWIRTC